MRKLLLVLFLSITVYGADAALATKIYLSIAKELTGVNKPSFYLHGEIKYLSDNKKIQTVDSCEKADIIIVNNLESLAPSCADKLIFATRYKTFLRYDNIIGAFFWQKGRPNIVFRGSLLKMKGLKLDASFQKYIE